ncbi:MAG: Type 1 glutamine amidotransferase-like domain-containing protein [Oscillospiraceae bacterium]|nr:Type 1 glutamine amidotransferase-like domain-containing protein [Oscillospiraceae bacterium]
MTLFLTSSPCVCNAPRAILNPENNFLKLLRLSLPERPRCLFICADPHSYGRTDGFGRDMDMAFREAGMEFSEFAVLDGRNADDAQMLIWQSDMIILAGGHVPTQNAFFQEIGLRDMVANYQGVIMGISAGTMNCADRVYVQPEEPGESVPEFPRFAQGLGLTEVNVLPHYQMVKDNMLDGKRLFEDVTYADSLGECFFVLVDGSYILVEEDGSTTLFGEAYCLRDGKMEQICSLGESIILE